MCFFGCVPSKVVNGKCDVMSLGWMSFTENFYKVLKLQKTNIRMFIRPNLSPKLVSDFLVHQLLYDGLFKKMHAKISRRCIYTSLVKYRMLVDFRGPFNHFDHLVILCAPKIGFSTRGCDPLCNHDHFMPSKHWANGASVIFRNSPTDDRGEAWRMWYDVVWYVAVDGKKSGKPKTTFKDIWDVLTPYCIVTSCDKVYYILYTLTDIHPLTAGFLASTVLFSSTMMSGRGGQPQYMILCRSYPGCEWLGVLEWNPWVPIGTHGIYTSKKLNGFAECTPWTFKIPCARFPPQNRTMQERFVGMTLREKQIIRVLIQEAFHCQSQSQSLSELVRSHRIDVWYLYLHLGRSLW